MGKCIAAVLAALAYCACLPVPAVGEVLTGLKAPSPVLGHDIAYWAYLPAKSPPAGKRWPVVYLLHGMHGAEREWLSTGQIAPLLTNAIAEGKLPPLMVITPDGGNSWYVDNPDPGGYGRIATAFTSDLIDAVDATFPTAACREGRLLGGFSMGGTGAMVLGLDHPDLFLGAISLSGRFPLPKTSADAGQPPAGNYAGAFGEPFDIARFNSGNAFNHIESAKTVKQRPLLFLHVGDHEEPEMLEGAVFLHERLLEAKLLSRLSVVPGYHDFRTWRKGLIEALEWMAPKLVDQCP